MSSPELPDQLSEPQPDQPAEDAQKTPSSHRRNGTVARLPKDTRDQINQMLLDGVTYAGIIEKLGEPGKDLVEDHIRSWKKGGYQDWLLELDRKEALSATREAALDLLKEKAGATVQDAGRTIASAQLYELLLSFDPRAFAEALAEKPELYFRLINSLARLSEGEATCARSHQQSSDKGRLLGIALGNAQNVVASDTLKEIARLVKLL